MDTVTMQDEREHQEEQIVDSAQPDEQEQEVQEVQEQPREEQVPLSALQKERRKRQETEQELRWLKEQAMRQQSSRREEEEPDESHLEPATREELGKAEQKILRSVEEKHWIKQNPEKAEEIKEKLQEFLNQRPHLASAIENAPNRYEEAWLLMEALTPKQKIALRPQPSVKKDAPGSPTSAPKAAAINQAVDFSNMTDSEFNAWRQEQRRRK